MGDPAPPNGPGSPPPPRRDLHKVVVPACITGLLALVPWAYNTFSPRSGSKAVDASVVAATLAPPRVAAKAAAPDTGGEAAPVTAPTPPADARARASAQAKPPAEGAPSKAEPVDDGPALTRRVPIPVAPGETPEAIRVAYALPSPKPRPAAVLPPSAAARDLGMGSMVAAEREFQEAMRAEEHAFTESMMLEERAFLDEESRSYQQFVADVQAQWGEFRPSTQPVWSSYTNDKRGHGAADFEKGTLDVEVLVDDAARSPAAAATQLAGTLKAMTSPKNPLQRNPLEDLVDRGDGQPLRDEDLTKLVEGKVRQGDATRRTVKAADGRIRTVVAVKLRMVPNRLALVARPYLSLVKQLAERFGVPPGLVLAVIHTESYFNPFARSGAPAYGLMQLVPTSGAKEAYAFVHKVARKVEAQELYKPEVNVELGSAYLHLLLERHFKDMKDPIARTLASISAYNCGPRNTFKALRPLGGTGTAPPAGASAQEVFTALTEGTPQETRQYVRLVSGRMPLWNEAAR